MAGLTHGNVLPHGFGRHSNWLGRSGQAYGMVSENLELFAMADASLYLIAQGSHVLWVGSTDELVTDPLSRTRFRLALDCADRVLRVVSAPEPAQRLTTIWDLEGGEPLAGAQAA